MKIFLKRDHFYTISGWSGFDEGFVTNLISTTNIKISIIMNAN